MGPFVLVDCNNFYVSCERMFNPKLEGKPVIILSNNDGCVVARSKEAKALGIEMAVPFFTVRKLCQQHGVVVQSSNYQLYRDISHRIMTILTSHASLCEIYSIDEAFLRYPSCFSTGELFELCCQLRKTINTWIGVPVSLGIGLTKTQAKLANYLVKKNDLSLGVYNICESKNYEEILSNFSLTDVWGIGLKNALKLSKYGIHSALEYIQKDRSIIRSLLGVNGERIYWELKGIPAVSFEEGDRKSIMSSRSFGKTVAHLSDLEEALSTYAFQACIKMRKQESYTHAIQVYLKFVDRKRSGKCKHVHAYYSFSSPVNNTSTIISAAKMVVKKLYSSAEVYKKCGIILHDLVQEKQFSKDLFVPSNPVVKEGVSKVVDQINHKFGKRSLFYAAMGTDASWKMRSEHRSLHYTTDWNELATVKAN